MTTLDTTDLARGLAQVRALRESATPAMEADLQRGDMGDRCIIVRPPSGAPDDYGDMLADVLSGAADLNFLAAAPAMADLLERYAERLAEVEAERDRLAAELAEARRVLAAERGVGGAPSDAWRYQQHHRNDMGAWHRGGATVKKWGRGSASWLLTMGTAGTGHETAREAMQAADAALRGNGDDEIHAAAAAVDGRTGEPL